MNEPLVRKATPLDLEEILRVYEQARQTMIDRGNPSQWGKSYPPKEVIENDVKEGNLYVVTLNGDIHGVFAFILGEDPTYQRIVKGNWISSSPYGTIHRVASDGAIKGLFPLILSYCLTITSHLRMDTHEDNFAMRHLALKYGFQECGVIFVKDGSPRIAFERIESD